MGDLAGTYNSAAYLGTWRHALKKFVWHLKQLCLLDNATLKIYTHCNVITIVYHEYYCLCKVEWFSYYIHGIGFSMLAVATYNSRSYIVNQVVYWFPQIFGIILCKTLEGELACFLMVASTYGNYWNASSDSSDSICICLLLTPATFICVREMSYFTVTKEFEINPVIWINCAC